MKRFDPEKFQKRERTKKRLFLAAAALCFLLALGHFFLPSRAKDGVISLRVTSSGEFGGLAITENGVSTGVVIGEDDRYYYALTCNHCTETAFGGGEITAYNRLGKKASCELLKASASYDLALLRFPKEFSCRPVPFSEREGEEGCRVSQVDRFFFRFYGRLRGKVSAPDLLDFGASSSEVTFPVLGSTVFSRKGTSGGPLLDEDGALLGVTYAAKFFNIPFFGFSRRNETYSVPVPKIREFLGEVSFSLAEK